MRLYNARNLYPTSSGKNWNMIINPVFVCVLLGGGGGGEGGGGLVRRSVPL